MNPALAKYYDKIVQKVHRWDQESALLELNVNQYQPPEILKKQRLRLLKDLLGYCNQYVPYYRSLWNNIGFSPQSINDERDIQCLPTISKNSLRDNYDSFLSEKPPPYDVWKSSGSTGEPFPFRLDKNTITYNTFGALLRGKEWWRVKSGVPEGMIWSGVSDATGTFLGKLECQKRKISWSFKNIKLIDVYNLDLSTIAKGYSRFLKHQPVFLRSISSGLYRFCSGLKELGLDGKRIGLRGAIYTGEGLSSAQKKFIEEVLGCPAICEYGCAELGIIGFECPAGSIHLSSDNLLLEYFKNDCPAKPGETAELVVTNLRNFASPLIRYSIGDFVLPSSKMCTCGVTLPIIEQVQGRVHDSVVTRDGVAIHGLFFTHLFDKHDNVHQFKVIQEDINNLFIEIVASENIDDTFVEHIKKRISEKFGPNVAVHVKQTESLPTAARGKTPWIVSKVE